MSKLSQTLDRQTAVLIGGKVHSRRLALGLSQEQLGERADIHRTYIGAVERGEKNVTVVTLAKIARALRCKLIDLLPEGANAH